PISASADPRPPIAWVGSAAWFAIAPPGGRRAVHSCLCPVRVERRCVAARDLEVSLGDILEHLFFERQRRQRAFELRVFLLQILQLLGLFYLQATVLLPPP